MGYPLNIYDFAHFCIQFAFIYDIYIYLFSYKMETLITIFIKKLYLFCKNNNCINVNKNL